MMDVVLQRLPEGPKENAAMRGCLLAYPQLGVPLAFLRLADGQRIVTSEVTTLCSVGDSDLYARTANSWYRIHIIWRDSRLAQPPVRRTVRD